MSSWTGQGWLGHTRNETKDESHRSNAAAAATTMNQLLLLAIMVESGSGIDGPAKLRSRSRRLPPSCPPVALLLGEAHVHRSTFLLAICLRSTIGRGCCWRALSLGGADVTLRSPAMPRSSARQGSLSIWGRAARISP